MAVFTSYHNFRFDALNPGSMGAGQYLPVPPVVTPTKATVLTTGGAFDVYGSGLSISPPSGVVTEITFSQNGRVVASVTDIEVPAVSIYMAMQGDSPMDLITAVMSERDTYHLGDADDIVPGYGGNDVINGGGGTDTSLHDGLRSEYSVKKLGDGSYEITRGSERDILNDVELVRFDDGVLRLDVDGNAGQAFRLYQAVFEREPDAEGLQYWVNRMDEGNVSLVDIADSFLFSPEFVNTYGTEDTVSNAEFVDLLYTHTLGRAYDQEGYNYWVGKLDDGATNRRDLIAQFSESAENKAQVAELISDGIWLGW